MREKDGRDEKGIKKERPKKRLLSITEESERERERGREIERERDQRTKRDIERRRV